MNKKLKRFVKYYKPYKSLFIIDFVSAFMLALLGLVFPFLTSKIIDDYIPNGKNEEFIKVLLILVGVQLLMAIFSYIVISWGHILGIRIRQDMREDLYGHLQKLSMSYYDKTKTGEIISRIMGDLEIISELAHHGPEDFFIALVMLVGSFILMFSMSPLLTFLVFASLPLFFYFALRQNRKMKKGFKDVRKKNATMSSEIEDTIAGIRVVKAFANEEYAKKRFDKSNELVGTTISKVFKTLGILHSGMAFFSGGIQLVALLFGGFMIFNGQLTLGILVGFFLFTSKFLEPIRKIINLLEMYQSGMAGFDRFARVMSTDPDIEDREKAKNLLVQRGEIKFESVSFTYNHEEEGVLEELNLRVKGGETLALVGPSGAGKSTICSLIPRFYEVNKGRVTIDKQDVKQLTQKSLRENIGIVQQDVFLFNGSIKENISFGKLEASDEEVIEAAKKANAYEFIMELPDGFDTYVGERGVRLSGGQKQRISIARIFLKNPKILLLDEATSALDNHTELLIQNSLNELAKNRTTIIIAHRLSTIKNADRIIVLDRSGVVEEGNHNELLELEGHYAKLYKAQFHGFIPDKV